MKPSGGLQNSRHLQDNHGWKSYNSLKFKLNRRGKVLLDIN